MGKRSREERATADDDVTAATEAPTTKKSRKDKISPDAAAGAQVAPISEQEADGIEPKKKSKKSKKEKKPIEEPEEEQNGVDSPSEEKLSKAERKALKKAKKEARAAADASVDQEDNMDVEEESNEDLKRLKLEKKANIAAHKADKALKKALKKEKKEKNALKKEARGIDEDPIEANGTHDSQLAPPAEGAIPEPAATTSGYEEHPQLTELPAAEVESFLADNFITVTDHRKDAPTFRPIVKFKYLQHIPKTWLAPFERFEAPTPIQAAAWPALFAGRDVIGVAETGSGKTFAFGLPCIRHIMSLPTKERKQKGAKAVMVSPTRELALQIHEELVKIAQPAGLEVVCIYGGVPKDQQREALKTASIIVATPGRLNDLLSEEAANISNAHYLVLDEADRMLDKGFENDIRTIIGYTPSEGRQTLMFTATWPASVRELASTFMTDPVKITIGDNPTGELRANTRIKQIVEVMDQQQKKYRMMEILKQHTKGDKQDNRILVFALYKKEATRIENEIKARGFRVGGIHGDLSQRDRIASLEGFKTGKVPILVATDVAARGLDIPAVKLVLNVTFPLTAEDYVHRIGRTGRAGQDGLAITFFTEQEKALSGALINVLKAAKQDIPDSLMKFGTTVKKKQHEAYGAFVKDIDPTVKATKIVFD
ncbi:DEAD-domain-containing protein [Aulographum hederae CBS 113979]|uniref:RNA helicase n=1 Tax=Aulographum hederae CBS 113979 TaxID=1176131 RepID=A0A6G1GRV5_9PEZI|nr:DEAD-domain-containing protein [Aulographum hederae CBS 113979]